MIPLGLNKNGELLAADQVPRGLDCGVVCPVCKTELVARQGEIKAWHFAHYGDGASGHGACGEGALHIAAKEIIRKSIGKYLILPSSIQRWSKQPQGAVPLPSTKRFRIQSVDTEKHFSAINRRVDAWVSPSSPSHQSVDVALEFNVHHAKEPDAIEAFEEANLFVVEVDLSYNQVLDLIERKNLSIVDALGSLILIHTDNKRWLSHGDYGRNLSCVHPGLDDCGKSRCDCTCSFCVGQITQINANIEAQRRERERLQKIKEELATPVILRDIIKKFLRRSEGKKHLSLPEGFLGWSKKPEGAEPFKSNLSHQFLIKSVQLDKVLHTGKKVDAFVSLGVRNMEGKEASTTQAILQFGDLDKDPNITASVEDFEKEGVSALHFKFDFDRILSWMEGQSNLSVEGAVSRYFLNNTEGKRWLYHREFGTPLECDHPYYLQHPHGCKCPCGGCELMRASHKGWRGQFGCVKCGEMVKKPYIRCYNCYLTRRDP